MTQDSHGLHHAHKRKRIHQKHEPYPHPNKFKRFLDKFIYFIGIIGPIMTLPQVYNIWVLKQTIGVSVITWITYLFAACFWLLYGISHKEKPIIITQSIWIILDILIVIGLVIY